MDEKEINKERDKFEKYMSQAGLTTNNFEKIFIVDDSFSIGNNMVVSTGKVTKGTIKIGDTLSYIDNDYKIKSVTVTEIIQYREKLSKCTEGMAVGLKFNKNVDFNCNAALFKVSFIKKITSFLKF